MSNVRTYEAVAQLYSAIAGLKGPTSGYRTNLGGRVYVKDLVPEDGGITLPFATIVQDDEQTSFETDTTIVSVTLPQTIRMFFAETKARANASEAVLRLYDAMDDVVKALSSDWSLAGTVKEVEIVNAIANAASRDKPYGDVRMAIELRYMYGPNDIGP